jgi:hypothetical protein
MSGMLIWDRRVRDQEARSRKREERQRERLDRLETMVYAQHEKLDRLEDLVYRVMHRDRVTFHGESESPPYENTHHSDIKQPQAEVDAAESAPYSSEMNTRSARRKSETRAQLYPISNV